jgi:hypothetical protein
MQPARTLPKEDEMNSHKEAIAACMECHITCQAALAFHGDEEGGKQLSSQHIKRMMACIELCQVTANMLAIRAPMLDQLCELCARMCEQCATSCEAKEHDAMKACASACQRCAKALLDESHHIKQAA